MKKLSAAVLATVLAAILMVPASSFAWGRPYHGRRVVVHRHHGYNGAAVAAGVIGGLATGIILDRVLFPPPVVVERDYPPPPAPRPRDPYDTGYSDGYSEGVERGRYERYDQGRRRGYQEGYEDARTGRGR